MSVLTRFNQHFLPQVITPAIGSILGSNRMLRKAVSHLILHYQKYLGTVFLNMDHFFFLSRALSYK